ncbi:MAG: hypothetical protein C4K60_18015 [Ideonella sp. MAG2]|nr:MAG: hypothetical protein C4K60_18015 [Ideonella sp. MAG2]
MKWRIPQACQRGGQSQACKPLSRGHSSGSQGKTQHGHGQHGPCADFVHHKTGRGLPQAGNHEKRADQQAQLRIAEAKLGNQHGEQGR